MEDGAHAQVPVPPPLVFLGFLIGALALNLLLPIPTPWPGVMSYLGWLSVVGGFLLAALGVRSMFLEHTSPDPHQPSAHLVTRGPYRWTRNPIYLGFALVYLGFTFVAGTAWGMILLPVLLIIVTKLIVHAEESYLLARFGPAYRAYLMRVRRWV